MALGVLGARGKKRGIILPEGLGTFTKRRQWIWVLKDREGQQQEGREVCPGLRGLPSLRATHAHFSSSVFQDLKELSHPWAGELSPGWREVWWELSQSLTCGCCHGLECHLGIFKDSSQSLECRCRKDPQRVVSPVVPKLASSEPQCSPEAASCTSSF